jgi:hypothetical protein
MAVRVPVTALRAVLRITRSFETAHSRYLLRNSVSGISFGTKEAGQRQEEEGTERRWARSAQRAARRGQFWRERGSGRQGSRARARQSQLLAASCRLQQ